MSESPISLEVVQRRTVRVLVLTQAVGAVGITIGIATASLLARDLSGSEAMSGLAQTAQVLGAAVISFLLAPLMARRGRAPAWSPAISSARPVAWSPCSRASRARWSCCCSAPS